MIWQITSRIPEARRKAGFFYMRLFSFGIKPLASSGPLRRALLSQPFVLN